MTKAAIIGALLLGASLPALAQDVVVALGDSITAGSGLASPETQKYPAILAARAAAAGHPVTLRSTAASGAQSVYAARQATIALGMHPKMVLLMIGTNDAYFRLSSPDAYAGTLAAVVESVRLAGARIVLITPPLRGSGASDVPGNSLNESTGEYAEAMRRVAREHDAPCADVFADWSSRRGLTGRLDGIDDLICAGDTIHPNALGHQAIADLAWPTFWNELTR